MKFRILKQLPRLIYGKQTLARINELLPDNQNLDVFIIYDSAVKDIITKLFINNKKFILHEYDCSKNEPYTHEITSLLDKYSEDLSKVCGIVGIGGGSTMDMAKGLSVCLTNNSTAEKLQGWDLPTEPGLFKIGVPTIFGSGSEASRTAVFHNGMKKQGINSDYSMFDAIIIDPSLSKSVQPKQKIYTAMDCYIHSVESLEGTYINLIAKGYAEKALEYCQRYFEDMSDDEFIAVASYYGGVSIVNSEVGICHALSYGLSIEFGIRHGLANCIVFNVLDEYYGKHCVEFRKILKKYNIKLPKLFDDGVDPEILDKMVKQTFLMERPLENALGTNWSDILTQRKIEEIYKRM